MRLFKHSCFIWFEGSVVVTGLLIEADSACLCIHCLFNAQLMKLCKNQWKEFAHWIGTAFVILVFVRRVLSYC
jgi:hypothetical protein